ncbi:MAG: ZIP family metal transporter [Acidobacteria bacterium]|nr:ZIP family metal transporter [Acidobacteriota bacterium]
MWMALALGVVAAIADFCGGLVVVRRPWHPQYLKYFVALGSGFMLATALLEMLPESYTLLGNTAAVWIFAGYLLIHFVEHTLSPHFHFGVETHAEEVAGARRSHTVLFGLLIHTFADGIAIASGFLISEWLGWIVFLAVFLHKMPEGFAMSSVMLAAGKSSKAALFAAGLLGVATIAGVLVMLPLQAKVAYTLPISAGVTLYVAASDLIPEVNQEPGIRMPLVVFLGVVLLLCLQWIFAI